MSACWPCRVLSVFAVVRPPLTLCEPEHFHVTLVVPVLYRYNCQMEERVLKKGQLNRHTRYRPATTTRNTATQRTSCHCFAKGSVECLNRSRFLLNTVELFSTPYMYAQHQGSTRTCYKVRVEQVRVEHMFCVAQHGLRTNGIFTIATKVRVPC